MVKRMGTLMMVSFLALGAALAQEAPVPTQSTQESPAEGAAQPPAQRVVGQAASQAELDAWSAILGAATLAEKATMAGDFLKQFPESGLTANAHYLIAMNAYQEGNVDEFIKEAETTLAELPRSFDLLSHLAFYYAERHEPQKAVDRANAALGIISGLSKPFGSPAEEWVSEMAKVTAEVNYALGRAYLEWSFKTKGEGSKENLQKAIAYFDTALQNDPQHDFANFRMATAVRNTGDVTRTLIYYGRCVAIGGAAAAPARNEIENILKIVNKSLPNSQWAGKSADEVVAAARLRLLQSVSDAQAARDHQVQLLKERDAAVTQPPVATPPTGSAGSPPAPPGR